ncbi:MAG: hypothetical protein KGL39_53905 [Patescibacteria group bacterium]|nr:hypothetical protein [Patescibacteria group bacterium]
MDERSRSERGYGSTERLLVDPSAPVDNEPNPKILRCPFCPKLFRFLDQVEAHAWAKHRGQIILEIVSLRQEIKEARDAAYAFKALARERR